MSEDALKTSETDTYQAPGTSGHNKEVVWERWQKKRTFVRALEGTYGEVYNNSPGGSPIPTMNGCVSHYRTNTGSRLTRYTLSSPYRITHASGTGFTFSK